MVALQPYNEQQRSSVSSSKWRWVYIDPPDPKPRGVLIAYVKTPNREVYLFEVERRNANRTADDGSVYSKEQAFTGLIVSPPAGIRPGEWIPQVLTGIREQEGVMSRVMRYCPGHLVDIYRRSSSKGDEIAGHSTVVGALGKLRIYVPHPKAQLKTKTTGKTSRPGRDNAAQAKRAFDG
ncbi:MAG: hypothetical protein EON58_18245 [Alphaproteobacteria bacterium]|nr:MAG: hypothetical protein EON58_18245 [Alphaproteobacteria bacterium]